MIAVLLLQEPQSLISRVWFYLDHKFRVGNIEVSITSLLEGVVILAVAFMLSRTLSRLLQRRIAKRAYLDPGLQYTLGRLTQYVIITIGILLALSVGVSLNLTSIAVIFTALSVGIGFGLQYIAADIASGIQAVDIAVPIHNHSIHPSQLHQQRVIFQRHRVARVVRADQRVIMRGDLAIPVGVAYGSDVELVTRTLMEATEGVDNVLRDPPPKVQFLSFGDWSLDFRLLVWTNRPRLHTQIRSDINYRIDRLFRQNGIEIPFPQTELRLREGALHLDTGERLIAEGDSTDHEAH